MFWNNIDRRDLSDDVVCKIGEPVYRKKVVWFEDKINIAIGKKNTIETFSFRMIKTDNYGGVQRV